MIIKICRGLQQLNNFMTGKHLSMNYKNKSVKKLNLMNGINKAKEELDIMKIRYLYMTLFDYRRK